jgi:hypothetical protein
VRATPTSVVSPVPPYIGLEIDVVHPRVQRAAEMRNNNHRLGTTGREQQDALAVEDAPRAVASPQLEEQMPLTAALLRVAAAAVSFATPGHRGGRTCPLA